MTYNRLQTYAEIMREYAQRPNHQRPASRHPSKLLWDGDNSAVLIGMVCHDLLRDHGKVDYQSVNLTLKGYFLNAVKNRLQVISIAREEMIFESTFGQATRTMNIVVSSIRPADTVRFSQIIRLSFEVRCMEASLINTRKSKLPNFIAGIKGSSWDVPPEEVPPKAPTPRGSAQLSAAEARKVYATRPLPPSFSQADSILR